MLIILGLTNTIHGLLHLVQFAQSMLLLTNNDKIKHLIENPIFTAIMGIVGILTLIVGIKDFTHHKKCKH
jgi:membrane-bound ClpP family serine protease